jgi:hypothetical protein
MSKIAGLRAALLKLLEEHRRDRMLPTSARFLFYELVPVYWALEVKGKLKWGQVNSSVSASPLEP